MKFYFEQITLWLKNGKIRKLEFKPNKVNVITGGSGTGKSEIISIIDYCFFSSKVAISEEVINENVEWYGITFTINNSKYTIARRGITNGISSKEYYFSSIGELPEIPFVNNSENDIKKQIEKEFSIDSNTVIPYGGNSFKIGSKISFKYFMLFNTLPGNVIDNEDVFYEKQNQENYREALPRIFDIAFRIDTVNNIMLNEKLKKLDKELTRLKRKQEIIDNERNLFEDEMRIDIRNAKSLGLIPDTYVSPKEFLSVLSEIDSEEFYLENNDDKDKLIQERNRLIVGIRNYNNLEKEYSNYIGYEKSKHESLKPIEYIKSNFEELFIAPETAQVVNAFETELNIIKQKIQFKDTLTRSIKEERDRLIEELDKVNKKLEQYPEDNLSENIISKRFMFAGELKYKLSRYKRKQIVDSYTEEINKIEEEMENIKNDTVDSAESKASFINILEYSIQKNLDEVGNALGNYNGFRAVFEYKDKSLKLRKPSSKQATHVGSSSNHMFMHLSLSLGLHEASIIQESPYIPRYLILDQPSRPYFGDEKDDWKEVIGSDRQKIGTAMELLNNYINRTNEFYEKDFQIILLEHIPIDVWEGLNNFHLVEEFRYGNALINLSNEE